MKHEYKTPRKYKCPFCDFKAVRGDLIDHVDREHDELIPEGYTAARSVFDSINGRNYGTCMICHENVYKWNDKINRYYNLCNKQECRKRVREIALERHIRVYNKPTLLNDPEQQEKMLANRKISGSYTFSDGSKVTYTGKYEKNALEFIDKVLEIPGSDIQCPGPVLEYEYNGKSHKYISDIYYIPANLLIEVKDGGSNPNKRSMNDYRAKQIAKEEMITNLGTFNYIRLTDNQFDQLLYILADIKSEIMMKDNPKMKIHINEEVGGLPPNRPSEAYIVPYGINNTFSGFAYHSSDMDSTVSYYDDNGEIINIDEEVFEFIFEVGPRLYYKGNDLRSKINKINEFINSYEKNFNKMYFAEALSGKSIRYPKDILFTECFEFYDKDREQKICSLIENAVKMCAKDTYFTNDSNVIDMIENVSICHSPKGYYACTKSDFYMCSEYFSDIGSLKSSDAIKLMNDVYEKRRV